jgi:hypothetical protein
VRRDSADDQRDLRRETDPLRRLASYGDGMDVSSMIMGGAIASIVWIAFYPWAKLKRLKELEDGGGEAAR